MVGKFVEGNIVNRPNENAEAGLWVFGFNSFGEYKGGGKIRIHLFYLFVDDNWDLV